MKTYLITGGTFRLDNGDLKAAGDTIDLEDDVAEANKHQLQLVQAEATDKPADTHEA